MKLRNKMKFKPGDIITDVEYKNIKYLIINVRNKGYYVYDLYPIDLKINAKIESKIHCFGEGFITQYYEI